MELLVALLDAEQDADRILLVGRRNFHRLEAALERPILLDRLAIFGRRCRPDALDLTARQGRLEDIGRVEGALGRACTDQRVQLINEDDGVLIFHQLFHDGLETLFKLAAILCAGNDQGQIERQDTLVG